MDANTQKSSSASQSILHLHGYEYVIEMAEEASLPEHPHCKPQPTYYTLQSKLFGEKASKASWMNSCLDFGFYSVEGQKGELSVCGFYAKNWQKTSCAAAVFVLMVSAFYWTLIFYPSLFGIKS